MTGPTPTPGDELNRRSNRSIAWIGVGSGLAIALVGLFASVLVAHFTNQSQAQQAQRDFVRSQRQTSFAKFLTDEHKASDDEDRTLRALLTGQAGAVTYNEVVIPDVELVRSDLYNVELLGSIDAFEAAAKISGDHEDISRDLYDDRLCDGGTTVTAGQKKGCQDANTRNGDLVTKLFQDRNQFIASARSDLGIPN